MIERELYMEKVKLLNDNELIKVLTGIRRSGKSVLLELIVNNLKKQDINENNIILINFEESNNFSLQNITQLDEYIKSKTKNLSGTIYLFFDEIQEVKNWEKLINSFFAQKKFNIYITGSNSKLLSGELATYLTGRTIQIKMYPFSFKEYLKFKKEYENKTNIKELFREYLRFGGIPTILSFDEKTKLQYLHELYDSIILNDIVQRYHIRDIDLLKRISSYIMQDIGHIISAGNIEKYLKQEHFNVSINTIYNYLNYFEDACLIYKVNRRDIKGKNNLRHSEKYFLADVGFRETIIGNNLMDISQILENIVYLELLRRDYEIYVGKLDNKEVDFIAKKGNKTIYIQVTYILTDEKTIKREFEPLLNIKDNYDKYVLTMDELDRSNYGIKHRNIIDFLLSDEI